MDDLFDVAGKRAIVTGGSRGLGKEIVLALAARGADVMVVSRKLDACEVVAADARDKFDTDVFAYACHVGHWDELDGLVDAAYERWGAVDILINNAGMSPLYPDPSSVTEELYDKVLAVNLKGPSRLSALVGARMVAGDGGCIVNVSSVGSIRPDGTIIPYAAAKAGLNAMTVAFARAYGPKVRVNCVMPGSFMTDVTKEWDMDAFARSTETFALKRGADASEIVGTVLYLVSDASSYTTGAVLRVDGGVR